MTRWLTKFTFFSHGDFDSDSFFSHGDFDSDSCAPTSRRPSSPPATSALVQDLHATVHELRDENHAHAAKTSDAPSSSDTKGSTSSTAQTSLVQQTASAPIMSRVGWILPPRASG